MFRMPLLQGRKLEGETRFAVLGQKWGWVGMDAGGYRASYRPDRWTCQRAVDALKPQSYDGRANGKQESSIPCLGRNIQSHGILSISQYC